MRSDPIWLEREIELTKGRIARGEDVTYSLEALEIKLKIEKQKDRDTVLASLENIAKIRQRNVTMLELQLQAAKEQLLEIERDIEIFKNEE